MPLNERLSHEREWIPASTQDSQQPSRSWEILFVVNEREAFGCGYNAWSLAKVVGLGRAKIRD